MLAFTCLALPTFAFSASAPGEMRELTIVAIIDANGNRVSFGNNVRINSRAAYIAPGTTVIFGDLPSGGGPAALTAGKKCTVNLTISPAGLVEMSHQKANGSGNTLFYREATTNRTSHSGNFTIPTTDNYYFQVKNIGTSTVEFINGTYNVK